MNFSVAIVPTVRKRLFSFLADLGSIHQHVAVDCKAPFKRVLVSVGACVPNVLAEHGSDNLKTRQLAAALGDAAFDFWH